MDYGITCRNCSYLEIRRTEKAQRGRCICSHKSATALSKVLTVENESAFISFTPKNEPNIPKAKTSPRWCPQKLEITPMPIDKKEAYAILSDRSCRGLFYTIENDGITAIDAVPDDPFLASFPTVSGCIAFLIRRGYDRRIKEANREATDKEESDGQLAELENKEELEDE